MRSTRRPAAAASALCLFVGVSLTGTSQVPPTAEKFKKEAPRVPGEAVRRIQEMQRGERPVAVGPEVAQNKADLKMLAKSRVYPVTDPDLYFRDLANKKGELAPPLPGSTVADRIKELESTILVPTVPTATNPLKTDQVDYIKEYGAALAETFRELNLAAPATPDYIRVNGGRMLAAAGRSGAPALAAYTTEILNNPTTPPQLTVYALQAAGNLLAAYNPNKRDDAQGRFSHLAGDTRGPELYELVKAVEAVVLRDKPFTKPAAATAPPPAAPAPAAGPEVKGADPKAKAADPKAAAPKAPPPAPAAPPAAGKMESDIPKASAMTPEQLAVFHFIRREAVQALARCRYPVVTHPNGRDAVRPIHTLAKVAVADTSLPVPPRADEAAEAVIGLCNVVYLRGVGLEAQADAVAQGLIRFARPKTNNNDDKMLPWKQYSARLAVALADWQKAVGNVRANARAVGLSALAKSQVLDPIDRLGAAGSPGPDLQGLVEWRTQNPTKESLLTDAPTLTLSPAPAGG